jgi:putative IMPACT (imprinted ancient) family translation regulator
MLTTLLHSGIGEIVAVTARYYGGTKLGTGGLSRAYAGGVKLALETLPVEELVARAKVEVVVGYAHVDGLQRLLDELGGELEHEAYGADVRYVAHVPEVRLASFQRRLADLTVGQGRVRRLD